MEWPTISKRLTWCLEHGMGRRIWPSLGVQYWWMNLLGLLPLQITSDTELFFLLPNHCILKFNFLIQFMYFLHAFIFIYFPHFSSCHLPYPLLFTNPQLLIFLYFVLLYFSQHSEFSGFSYANIALIWLPSSPPGTLMVPLGICIRSCRSPSTPPQPELFGLQSTVSTEKWEPETVLS